MRATTSATVLVLRDDIARVRAVTMAWVPAHSGLVLLRV